MTMGPRLGREANLEELANDLMKLRSLDEVDLLRDYEILNNYDGGDDGDDDGDDDGLDIDYEDASVGDIALTRLTEGKK